MLPVNEHLREDMLKISQAMILAAGLGTRMGELTQEVPKPMLVVEGQSLIERHLHYLFQNNIKKIVINSFYKAELLEMHIKSLSISAQLDIYFSREMELLGTGGGVKNALPILGKEPFFVVNSDAYFVDHAEESAFVQLEKNWNPEQMPIMILLVEKHRAFGYRGKGDFDLDPEGRLNRTEEVRQYIYSSMQVMDYRLFEDYSERVLQFFPTVYQDLIAKRKLYGCVYQGDWFHIGDLEAYRKATS